MESWNLLDKRHQRRLRGTHATYYVWGAQQSTHSAHADAGFNTWKLPLFCVPRDDTLPFREICLNTEPISLFYIFKTELNPLFEGIIAGGWESTRTKRQDKMLPTTGLRRAVALSTRVQNQRRFGGSLSKNKHIEVRVVAMSLSLMSLCGVTLTACCVAILFLLFVSRTTATGVETRRSASSSTKSSSRPLRRGPSSRSRSTTLSPQASAYVLCRCYCEYYRYCTGLIALNVLLVFVYLLFC